jgi:hypothetical protein
MILHVNKKGAEDLINHWSVGAYTRHVEVRHHSLCELKEKNIVKILWISTHDNPSDTRKISMERYLVNTVK